MTELQKRMAGGASSTCRAWVIHRRDGLTLGFTDHDGDLMVDGVQCSATSGLTAGALQFGTGLAVDNAEVVGALSDDALTTDDIRAGRWDGAEVVAYLVDWREPDVFEILFRGSLGEITEGGGQFSAELRGISEALNTVRGRVYHSRCDAALGDARCAVDLDAPGRSLVAEIIEVTEGGRVLWLNDGSGFEDYWFERGRVRMLSGAAVDLVELVKFDKAERGGRRIELWSSIGASIAVGDQVRIETGCDKSMSTCRDKFENLLNFRGFPHIPGDNWTLALPATGAGR
ncbi:DUF2163 domain-containing protein [Jannaschia aquimarina]|uniref:Bacteriophage phiJL001 Gp84 C-terminal domain-containing protein n=1 Tax=Jannaschia aquimarina TaxID=935700 RepID=A0A0D1EJY3_9RHOB|nr:DUF2163 domain-containing protein [Jannaschia aquimarina]KIT17296.1 hypothetical protein jaqu_10270 [Jannaschia aquimarina]SNT19829.1 phage conserved hypothetical protein BR0599 [Jannaschia aquimarina]